MAKSKTISKIRNILFWQMQGGGGKPDTLTHVNQVSSGYKQMSSGCRLGLNVLGHAWFYDFIHLNWISCLFNMVFSAAEKELIKTCYVEKGWLVTRIVQEFPGKRWNCRSVNRVIQLFKRTGSVARQPGSGRPRTARSEANKDYTEDNIQSQDNQPGTDKSQILLVVFLVVTPL